MPRPASPVDPVAAAQYARHTPTFRGCSSDAAYAAPYPTPSSAPTSAQQNPAVVLAPVFGPALLGLAPLVALSAWARVELEDHTLAQVVAGAAVGAAIAGVVFSALR